ncbi:tyrosine-type recombinase/integrase [Catelliglobosispora koreensis]|uniref:tyrosine-type recombinase/integrase n=1 Tax=Catelliglobosispora koreensis TaxID=129052 RepID=UPI00035C7E53|nr:site-specific integrase [Catelliglobosispora koreensis]
MSNGWVEPFTTASGDTRYRARYLDRRGKQQTENTYAKKRQAKRAATAAAVKARSGANTDFALGKQKFSTYVLETWLPNHIIEISTLQGYTGMINKHLLPWFGEMRLIDINAQTVREWITHLQTLQPKLSAKYLYNLKNCLSAIFSTAVNDEILPAHPVHGVKTPTVAAKVVKVITPEQFDVLYDELPYGDMQLLVETDIETGLRWSELIDLRPRDFSHGYTRITVTHAAVEVSTKFTVDGSRFVLKEYPKDGEHRVVQITQQLAAKLAHHVEVNQIGDDDLMFEYIEPPARPKPVKVVPDPETLGWTEPNAKGRIYQHGTKTAYTAAPCRCQFCRDAMSIYRAERRAAGKDRAPKPPTRQQREKHITKDWFRNNVWKPALRKAKLGIHVRVHDLRHAHASWLLAGGTNINVVKERLGHGSIKTTERYLHSLPDAQDEAVDAFASIRNRSKRR